VKKKKEANYTILTRRAPPTGAVQGAACEASYQLGRHRPCNLTFDFRSGGLAAAGLARRWGRGPSSTSYGQILPRLTRNRLSPSAGPQIPDGGETTPRSSGQAHQVFGVPKADEAGMAPRRGSVKTRRSQGARFSSPRAVRCETPRVEESWSARVPGFEVKGDLRTEARRACCRKSARAR